MKKIFISIILILGILLNIFFPIIVEAKSNSEIITKNTSQEINQEEINENETNKNETNSNNTSNENSTNENDANNNIDE